MLLVCCHELLGRSFLFPLQFSEAFLISKCKNEASFPIKFFLYTNSIIVIYAMETQQGTPEILRCSVQNAIEAIDNQGRRLAYWSDNLLRT